MFMYQFIENLMSNVNNNKKFATRKENVVRYLSNESDCGNVGKAFEIALQSRFSNRVTYAKQGNVDKYITMLDECGKKVQRKVEIKTNGGRIDGITASDYVIYGMDICNSTTKGIRRMTEVVIMPTTVFIEALENCGAIKTVNHNHKIDGYAIQVSKKSFYEFIKDYPIRYELDRVYSEDEF